MTEQMMGTLVGQATALALNSRMQQSMVSAGVCHALVLQGVAGSLTAGMCLLRMIG
jgi:hypothetical protein